MEKIINLVTRLRRNNFVLSNENLASIVGKYAFESNDKQTRRAIAAEITSMLKLNSPHMVVDVTLQFEVNQGAMTFMFLGHPAKLFTIHQTGRISEQF